MRSLRKRITDITTALTLLVAFSAGLPGCGCLANRPYFDLTEKKAKITPGTLAVISADDSVVSRRLAELVTADLQKRSTFRTLGQRDVTRKLPDPPSSMLETREIKTASGLTVDEELVTGKKYVEMLQKRLKTDYLLVINGGNLRKIMKKQAGIGQFLPLGMGSFEVDVFGELSRSIDGAKVGTSSFTMRESMGFTADESDQDNAYVEKLLQSTATALVDNFIDATRSGKSSQ